MTENCLITGGPANHPEIGDQEPCSCAVCRMDRELQSERQENDEIASDLVEALEAQSRLRDKLSRLHGTLTLRALEWRRLADQQQNIAALSCAAEVGRNMEQPSMEELCDAIIELTQGY